MFKNAPPDLYLPLLTIMPHLDSIQFLRTGGGPLASAKYARFIKQGNGLLSTRNYSFMAVSFLCRTSDGVFQDPTKVKRIRFTLAFAILVTVFFTFFPPQGAFVWAENGAGDSKLVFQSDASLGQLYFIHWSEAGIGWATEKHHFADAQGTVVVPKNKLVCLKVAPKSVKRLAHLDEAGPALVAVNARNVADFDDSSMTQLKGLKHLKYLDVDDTDITDEGVKVISGFTELEELLLDRVNISPKSLNVLHHCTKLRRLSLIADGIHDEDMSHIQSLTKLGALNLYSNHITDRGAEVLAKLPLSILNLKGNKGITRTSVKVFQRMPHLALLDVQGTAITSAAIPDFAKCTSLRIVEVSWSEAELEIARKAVPFSRFARAIETRIPTELFAPLK